MSDLTKTYYDENAETYAETTLPVRLDELWNAFSAKLWRGAYVLDLGCGAGRDLKELTDRGLHLVGMDYSPPLAEIARQHSGQKVWVVDIRDCHLEAGQFDGIWAVASLLHIPRNEVVGVLVKLSLSLRSRGIFLTSMKRGEGQEIAKDGRSFELYQPHEWDTVLVAGGFEIEQRLEGIDQKGSTGTHMEWCVTICRKRELTPGTPT